jgi:hypothetical protein
MSPNVKLHGASADEGYINCILFRADKGIVTWNEAVTDGIFN